MVLRTYDHNYRFEYYKPTPAHLQKKKKKKKSSNINNAGNKKAPRTNTKKHTNYPRQAPKLTQANENWLRRSDRARRFSVRAAANPNKPGAQGFSTTLEEANSSYGLNYMAMNSFQYDPYGSTSMSDTEIKRNLAYGQSRPLDVVVDSIEVERTNSFAYYDEKDGKHEEYWFDEEDEEMNCFGVFIPVLGCFQEIAKFCDNVQYWIDQNLNNIQNVFFKKTVKRRLSSSLLIKQAESNRKAEEEKLKKESPGADKYKSEEDLLQLSGPVGLALFSPFQFGSLDAQCKLKQDREEETTHDDEDSISIASSDSDDVPILTIPINLYQEDPSTVESYPHVLNMDEMTMLKPFLPPLVQLMKWERAYSVARDGDLFSTMLNKVECYKYTLLVIKTTKGEIFGGFADGTWRDDAKSRSKSYFGSGLSFLYSYEKKEDKEMKTLPKTLEEETSEQDKLPEEMEEKKKPEPELKVYKWSGANTYCQFCDIQKGKIAMGGGGSFGITVGEWFSRGSTGYSSTFENPPLSTEETFDIWEFEIYGFAPTAF